MAQSNVSNVSVSVPTEDTKVMHLQGTPIHAQTVAGAEYVRKVTHPPTPSAVGYQGCPDMSQGNFVAMEVKCEQNIPTTYQQSGTATAPGVYPVLTKVPVDGKILLLSPPGGSVSSYVFYWNGQGWVQPITQGSGATPAIRAATGNTPATSLAGYNFANVGRDVSKARCVYKSNTYYLNATDFNNQGDVTTAKFKPTTVTGSGTVIRQSLKGSALASFDKCMRTIQRTRAAHDGYEVIDPKSSDFDSQIQILCLEGTISQLDAVNPNTNVFSAGCFPETSNDMLTASPKAAARPAKDGAFVVAQPLDAVQLWSDIQDCSSYNGSSTNGYDSRYYTLVKATAANGGGDNYSLLYNGDVNVAGTFAALSNASDMKWTNLDWSMTMFEGLSTPTLSTDGIPINAPYITDKCFLGIELAPRSNGSLRWAQRSLPLPDPLALQMATGIFHARPDSLPAIANDLGLSAIASKYIPAAVGWLKGAFGKVNVRKVLEGMRTKVASVAKNKVLPAAKSAGKNMANKGLAAAEKRIEKAVKNAEQKIEAKLQPATPMRGYTNDGRPAGARQKRTQ